MLRCHSLCYTLPVTVWDTHAESNPNLSLWCRNSNDFNKLESLSSGLHDLCCSKHGRKHGFVEGEVCTQQRLSPAARLQSKCMRITGLENLFSSYDKWWDPTRTLYVLPTSFGCFTWEISVFLFFSVLFSLVWSGRGLFSKIREFFLATLGQVLTHDGNCWVYGVDMLFLKSVLR